MKENNKKNHKTVLISGYARSGKDTFANILAHICEKNYIASNTYSFAAELKRNLIPIIAPMGIDIFNPTDKQKSLIRNIMISYGCAWREIDINHWVKIIDESIENSESSYTNLVNIITDNRFISESNYFIDKYGRENVIIVEVRRKDAPIPPKEELENQPKISAIADFVIDWPTVGDKMEELIPYAKEFYNKFIK